MRSARLARFWGGLALFLTILTALTGLPTGPAAAAQRATRHGRAPDRAAARVVDGALRHLGNRYVWGGTGPRTWDCSGLTSTMWRVYGGVRIPRVAAAQQAWAVPVPARDVLPGDLVFFGRPAYHVGLALGHGWIVDASFSHGRVIERPIWTTAHVSYGRVPRPGMPAVPGRHRSHHRAHRHRHRPRSRHPRHRGRHSRHHARQHHRRHGRRHRHRLGRRPRRDLGRRHRHDLGRRHRGHHRRRQHGRRPRGQRMASRRLRQARAARRVLARFVRVALALDGRPWGLDQVGPWAFDQSGLIDAAWRRATGRRLPDSLLGLQHVTRKVARGFRGSLVFYGAPYFHVGIYLGHGWMIDSSLHLQRVVVRPLLVGAHLYFARLPVGR